MTSRTRYFRTDPTPQLTGQALKDQIAKEIAEDFAARQLNAKKSVDAATKREAKRLADIEAQKMRLVKILKIDRGNVDELLSCLRGTINSL